MFPFKINIERYTSQMELLEKSLKKSQIIKNTRKNLEKLEREILQDN